MAQFVFLDARTKKKREISQAAMDLIKSLCKRSPTSRLGQGSTDDFIHRPGPSRSNFFSIDLFPTLSVNPWERISKGRCSRHSKSQMVHWVWLGWITMWTSTRAIIQKSWRATKGRYQFETRNGFGRSTSSWGFWLGRIILKK